MAEPADALTAWISRTSRLLRGDWESRWAPCGGRLAREMGWAQRRRWFRDSTNR